MNILSIDFDALDPVAMSSALRQLHWRLEAMRDGLKHGLVPTDEDLAAALLAATKGLSAGEAPAKH